MTHKSFFRLVVALSLVAVIASGVTAAFPGDISSDWKAVLEWQGDGDILMRLFIPETTPSSILFAVFSMALLSFVLATQVGMFLFWRFARPSYALLVALTIFYTFFGGLLVMTPISATFYDLTFLLNGAIIAMSYLSPINNYFDKRTTET